MLNKCGHYTGGGSSYDECPKCLEGKPIDVDMNKLFKRMKQDMKKVHEQWLKAREEKLKEMKI